MLPLVVAGKPTNVSSRLLSIVQSSSELGASGDARIPREAQAGGFEQGTRLDGLELYPCYAQALAIVVDNRARCACTEGMTW